MRLFTRYRRNSDRNILQDFNQDTSESANDNRPKKRIALDPKDHLYALRSHTLDHNSGDFGIRILGRNALADAAERITNFRGAG